MKKKEIEIYAEKMTRARKICKCSHSIVIPPHLDKLVCRWCGKYVFKDKETEFKYRLKEKM